jgi:hypothetical protein
MAWDTFELTELITNTINTEDEIKDGFISKLNRVGKVVKNEQGEITFKVKEGLQAKLNIEITKKGDGYLLSVHGVTRLQTWVLTGTVLLIFLTFGAGFLIMIIFYLYKGKPKQNILEGIKSTKLQFENTSNSSN